MITEILSKKLYQMKLSLQRRREWPIDDTLGIDPFEQTAWRQFLDSLYSCLPVRTDALPQLSNTPDADPSVQC
jgi:hypothetical protein